MGHAYRSAYQQIVGTRLAEVKRAQELVEPYLPRLRSVGSARIARTLAGAVGIVGALSMTVCAALENENAATDALIGGGAAALGTYVLARAVLPLRSLVTRGSRWTMPALTGELDADLARIDASSTVQAIARRLGRLEVWSTALPLAAASLLMPLTLHFAFCLLFARSTGDFGRWISASLIIVGHAHLALMGLAVAFARKLARLETEQIARLSIHQEWAKALGITIVVSAVPGVLLLAIPPILTAITGLVFVPFMFVALRRRILEERATLATLEDATRIRLAGDPAAAEAFDEATWGGVEADAQRERSLVTSS